MTILPVMAIGRDRLWRTHLERIFAGREGVAWLGTREAGEKDVPAEQPAVLMVDGDDPATVHEIRSWRVALPQRLYFYRAPTVAALRDCVRGGASGCLEKHASQETVLCALHAVGAGLFAVEPALMLRAVLSPWADAPAQDVAGVGHEGTPAGLALLTRRQREIVQWAAQGLSNKQIARNLGISPETVKTHLHHAFERAGVSGRVALSVAQWARASDAESTVDGAS